MDAIRLDLEGLAARLSDGAKIALPPDYSYCAMALVRAIIARNVRDLHLVGVPALGFQADQLIGAGCVSTVETAAVTLGEFGLAPRFSASIKAAGIRMLDATCPAIHAGLQASEKGVPFMPLRGVIGSDVEKRRDDWVIGQNPFAENDPILMVKAMGGTRVPTWRIPRPRVTTAAGPRRYCRTGERRGWRRCVKG